MERLRLSISFKKEYRHIYEHLQSISNKSDFIGKAIDHYMNSGHSTIQNEKDIRKIILEILQNQGKLSQSLTQPRSPLMDQISDEEIELISQLF